MFGFLFIVLKYQFLTESCNISSHLYIPHDAGIIGKKPNMLNAGLYTHVLNSKSHLCVSRNTYEIDINHSFSRKKPCCFRDIVRCLPVHTQHLEFFSI